MGTPFQDITLYTYTAHKVGSDGYLEEISLINFVSDLYVQMMNGYKPRNTTRITIQPAFHEVWKQTWRSGSIVHTAPYYNYEQFKSLDKQGKYKYILDLIQSATIPLSEEYNWDKSVFENAYKKVLECDFQFNIVYPAKQSRDRKKTGWLTVEKSETITSIFVVIETNNSSTVRKLFDKKNTWCYDAIYVLAKHSKWFDTNKFGINFNKGKIQCWYSIEDEVELFENGSRVQALDFRKVSLFG